MFINCHRKQGFTQYYEELDNIANKLHAIGVTLNYSKLRRNKRVILITPLIFILFGVGQQIADLSSKELLDPIFGRTWNARNNSYEVYLSVNIFSTATMFLLQVQWIFYPAFFVSCCYYSWHMLSQFNKSFSEQVDRSTQDVVLRIETYRTTHLRLCKFVNRTDELFHIMLGNMMLNYVTSILILLYEFAAPSTTSRTILETISLVYWLLWPAVLSIICVILSQKLSEEVSNTLLLVVQITSKQVTTSFNPLLLTLPVFSILKLFCRIF